MPHMTTQKKLFLFIALIFLLIMLYVGFDIARNTSFPGSEPDVKERVAPSSEDRKSVV